MWTRVVRGANNRIVGLIEEPGRPPEMVMALSEAARELDAAARELWQRVVKPTVPLGARRVVLRDVELTGHVYDPRHFAELLRAIERAANSDGMPSLSIVAALPEESAAPPPARQQSPRGSNGRGRMGFQLG